MNRLPIRIFLRYKGNQNLVTFKYSYNLIHNLIMKGSGMKMTKLSTLKEPRAYALS